MKKIPPWSISSLIPDLRIKIVAAIVLCFGLIIECFGQVEFSSVKVGGRVTQLQAFALRDSIFISFIDEKFRQSYWINNNGKARKTDVILPSDAALIGVQLDEPGIAYYYYLHKRDRKMVVSTIKQNVKDGRMEFPSSAFPIEGKLLATHTSENGTIVVSYLEHQNSVRIINLNGVEITHDVVCEIPLDLSDFLWSNAGFISDFELNKLEHAAKRLKFYREKDRVILTIDQYEPGLENKRTVVIKINLVSGTRHTRVISRDNHNNFVSFYYQGVIHQVEYVHGRYLTIEAIDVESGQALHRMTFEKKLMKEYKVIGRRGSRLDVLHSDFQTMLEENYREPGILLQRTQDTTLYRLVVALVRTEPAAVVIWLPDLFIPIASIPIPAERVDSDVMYLTLKGNLRKGFDLEPLDKPATSLLHRIDSFEIAQTTERPKGVKDPDFIYKTYVESDSGVFGIYYKKGGKQIILIQHQ